MSKKRETFKNDRALKFYHDVLGLDRLHYGLWEDADERTLEGVKIAQKRYEDFLLSEIEKVCSTPSETDVLDVGCGSGVMSFSLYQKKFKVEGLSPDLYQQEVFEKKVPVRFHLARFQNFQPDKPYDIILMSESAQYIPMQKLFEKTSLCMKPTSYLMVCDYFTYDHASGPMAKSGHNLNSFLKYAEHAGLQLIKEQDITRQTIPTLETAKIFTDKYILPSVEIFSEKFRQKKPFLFKTLLWLLRKKIAKARKNLVLIDPVEFTNNKAYMYLLFKKQSS